MKKAEKSLNTFLLKKLSCHINDGSCHHCLFLGYAKGPAPAKLKKALNAAKHWHVSGDIVRYKGIKECPGISQWGPGLRLIGHGEIYFGRTLHVFLQNMELLFFIPQGQENTWDPSPRLHLPKETRQLLIDMANELDRADAVKFLTVTASSPEKKTLKKNRAAAQTPYPIDSDRLSTLLTEQPWLWGALLATGDLQLRVFRSDFLRPTFLFNLVCPKEEARQDLTNLLCALTLINEMGLCDSGPILCQDPTYCPDQRLYLQIDPERRVLRKAVSQITEADRARKRGIVIHDPLSSYPLFLSSSPAVLPFTVDLDLSPITPLDSDTLHLLTQAMCLLLRKDTVTIAGNEISHSTTRWQNIAWLLALVSAFGKVLGLSREAVSAGNDLLLSGENARLARIALINNAVTTLSDPAHWIGQLAEKPATKEDAQSLLKTYWGLHYMPTKGELAGKSIILCNDDGLRRSLGWSDSENIPLLLDALEEKTYLLRKKSSVAFSNQNTLRLHYLCIQNQEEEETL